MHNFALTWRRTVTCVSDCALASGVIFSKITRPYIKSLHFQNLVTRTCVFRKNHCRYQHTSHSKNSDRDSDADSSRNRECFFLNRKTPASICIHDQRNEKEKSSITIKSTRQFLPSYFPLVPVFQNNENLTSLEKKVISTDTMLSTLKK